MLKKLFISIIVILLILISLLIFVPSLYKGKISALVKNSADQNLNATLDFEDISLSFIRHFPNLSVSIEKLILINKSPFEGDTLASVKNFKIILNVMSLLGKEAVQVNSIILQEPRARLQILKNKTVNWDIIKEAQQKEPTVTSQEEDGLSLNLIEYKIENGFVWYNDEFSGMEAILQGLFHSGSGNFSSNQFGLSTETKIEDLTVSFGGLKYLNHIFTQLIADFQIDKKNGLFTLQQNQLKLNELLLEFSGFMKNYDEILTLDLQFRTKKTDFKEIISLIPAFYLQDFEKFNASGQMSIEGQVKGDYSKDKFPSFNFILTTQEGNIQHSELSLKVTNVNVDLKISNPGGSPDNTIIDLNRLQAKINQDPFNLKLQVKTPFSDPDINMAFNGKLDLKSASDLFQPTEETDLSGQIETDFQVRGKISNIKAQNYNLYSARGVTSLKDISINSPEMATPILVKSANLSFSPQKVTLSELQTNLGPSDLEANGSLENLFPFLLDNKTLKGTLTLNSRYMDLNPYLEGPSQQLEAIDLPGGVDFSLNSSFQEIQLGKFKATNVAGYLTLKDQTLRLLDLKMDLLGGSIKANGSYKKVKEKPASSLFDLEVDNMDFSQIFENFLTVQQFLPIGQSIQGQFNGRLKLASELDSLLSPNLTTLNSQGNLLVQKATVKDFKPLTLAANLLKMDKLKTLMVEKIEPAYEIKNGRFYLNPLSFSYENIEFLVSGSNGIDKSIDYSWKLKIPSQELSQQTNAYINQIFNRQLNLLQDDAVVIDMFFRGTVEEPNVNISGNSVVKSAKEKLIDIAKDQLTGEQENLIESVQSELEKQKKELENLKKLFK